jgi:hypothetical protein
MGARICPRCSTRVDERRARTSPFCLSCGAPLGASPSATFAGKAPGAGGGSSLPWILGGIAAVVLLGFGAVVVVLVAAASSADPEPTPVSATAAPPRVEAADAAAAAVASAPKIATAPPPTVRTPRPINTPTVVVPVPTPPPPPTVPPTSSVTTLGPFPRAKAQGEVDRIGFGLNSCSSSAGPFGSGTMRIDFEPDGRVGTLTRPPFAGTSVGTCISARFRTIKIGPFTGSTQSIEKAFIIQQ